MSHVLTFQDVVRNHKGWSAESVQLAFDISRDFKDDVVSFPASGVYIHGLYLENACWDRRAFKLTDARTRVGMNLRSLHETI